MAKKALGRGLGSLLGGSFEDYNAAKIQNESEQQSEAQPQRQTVPANSASMTSAAPAKPAEAPVQRERIKITTPDSLLSRPTTRPAAESKPKTIEEPVVTEEHVVVKSVSARNPEELPVDVIHRNPQQPRINFKKEELDELAASIAKDGLLQPILVRPDGESSYQIIAGERRYRASIQAGLKMVPVRIKEATDEETLELALIENIQRSDLNPIEEAYGYKRLMEKKGLTQSEVAQMVSKGRSTIANSLRLIELPEDAQQLLYEEKITAGHARAILSIPSAEGRQKLTEKMVANKISVREAENIARLLSASPHAAATTPRPATPKSYKKVARTLREKLETGVKIKTSQGRNRIEIEFKDEEDLQRLFASMFGAVSEAPAQESETVEQ